MSYAEEFAARERALAKKVKAELRHWKRGASRARWDRIKALKAEMDAMWKTTGGTEGQRHGRKRVYACDTPEWAVAANEYRDLHDLERSLAIEKNWPVWQEHQHFDYLDVDGKVRHGEVHAFDLDKKTVDATTWHEDEGIWCWDTTHHVPKTITLKQIVTGQRLTREREGREAEERRKARGPVQASFFEGGDDGMDRKRKRPISHATDVRV